MKKSIKQILCAMLVLVFIFANANVAFAVELKYPEVKLSYPKLYNSTAIDVLDFENCIDVVKFNAYMVEQLKLDDCVTGSDYVYVDVSEFKIPSSMSNSISEFIWYNSPELFNISGMNCSLDSTGEYISSIYFVTYYTKEEYAEMHSKMVEHAEILLYDVKGNNSLSDVEKALVLHDRLVAFNEYDYENYQNNTIPKESYNAYGALGLGTSVCMGYALAYDYLLEQVGIKSEYCSSDVLFHAWNIVYIDNKPYHVDVTWDDPVWDITGRVNHSNFLRSTQGIIETGHIGDDGTVDFTTTPVDTTYDNYFWQNSNASFEVIGDKIYYIDGTDQKLYEINDINDAVTKASLTTISDFSDFMWYYNSNGSYYPGAYSKLGSSYGLLYYSVPDGISCYNPVTKESKLILTPEEVAEDNTGRGSEYEVTGMNVFACIVSGEYNNKPYYETADVKKNNYFIITLHEEASEWTIVTPATTTTKGKKVLKCTKCNESIRTEEIPAVSEHTCNWSDWETVVTATCSAEGKQISKCSICYDEKTQTLPKLEHNFTEYKIQATCNATGLKYKECSVCKTKVTLETIPATNEHKASDTWVTGKAATCAEAGYEILPCVNCGAEMDRKTTAQLPHGETELADAKAPTCTQEGYSGNQRCKVCKTIISYGTKTAKAAHKSSDWIIEKIATFTQDGVKYRKCTVCGEKLETVTIPKLTHKSDSGTITKQPTCAEAGIKTFKCTKCGEVIKTESIPATGHTTTVINIKAATCTVAGYTGDTYCTTCKTVTNKGAVIPVKAHTLTVVNVKPATFEAEGFTGSEVCTVCNQTINPGSVIPKLTFTTPGVSIKNTAKGIEVIWNAVENAQSYDVYRRQYNASTKKWSGWKKIQTGYKSISYVDGTVILGTQYRYTVRAVNGTAMSAYKSTATLKYNVTPTVKVSNTATGVKVSWSTAANATGYRVYRSTYSNGKWSGWKNMGTAKATKTSWTDKNVKTGVSYKYTVRAVYNKVLSSYNKNGVAVTFLSVPTVKIANNASGIKVAWNKIAGATGYVVYSSQYDPATNKWSSWAKRGTVNATSWIDTAVQSGVTYKYTVRAANGNTLSAYKGTSGLMYLAQPTVKIANASKGVKVTWSQSAGALGYTVYRSEYDAKTKKWTKWKSRGTAAADKTSWTDKKVTSGVKYKYTVRAINGNVKSTYVSSGALLYLAQPTVNVVKNGNAITVNWNKVAGATGYKVYRKANNETKWSTLATIKSPSYVDKAVSSDGTYTYTVRAYNGKVLSSYNTSGETISLDYKKAVFELVNKERTKAGLAPVEYYYEGQKAGDIRVKEVGVKFSHERPDSTMCFTALSEQGIEYYSAGENIAKGYGTPELVMNAWMNSEGHKANILTPGFTHIIVGYDETTNAWVQLFLTLK